MRPSKKLVSRKNVGVRFKIRHVFVTVQIRTRGLSNQLHLKVCFCSAIQVSAYAFVMYICESLNTLCICPHTKFNAV